jgi:hypothetical protein
MQWVALRKREHKARWIRISITLSAKALEFLDYVRDAQDSSASEAIDYLILQTEPPELRLKNVDGIMTLDREDNGPPITNEDVQRILDEEYVYPRKTQKPTPRRTSVAISPEAVAIVERLRVATGLSVSRAISTILERPDNLA